MLKFPFLLSIILFSNLSYTQTIKNICQLQGERINRNQDLDHLNEEVCDFASLSTSSEMRKLSVTVYRGISRIKMHDSLKTRSELNEALKNVAELLDKEQQPKLQFSIENEQTSALSKLTTDFATLEQRQNNSSAYKELILKVLSGTKTGQRVMDCFYKKDSDNISESAIEITELGNPLYRQANATFAVSPDEKNPGKFRKVVGLTLKSDPISAISVMAHEFQHSCNSPEILDHRIHVNGVKQDHDHAVDELRAYKVSHEMFKELAVLDPNYFCQNFKTSSFYGKRIVKSGELYRAMEEELNEGTFIYTLLDHYQVEYIDPENVYVYDEKKQIKKNPKTGRPIINPDLVKKIKAAGFKFQN